MPCMEGGAISWLAEVELSAMLGGTMDCKLDDDMDSRLDDATDAMDDRLDVPWTAS